VEYIAYIRLILRALAKAGLYLDLEKYKFGVKTIKYLSFIIIAGKGIEYNPNKLYTIRE
jgi:hypothetical protein